MAKKILYKIRAYHCPRCGSVTEPTKKYCEYCERDLAIRSDNKNRIRLLIDCGNYVFFDSIKSFEVIERPSLLDITTLYDSRKHFIRGTSYESKFSVEMFCNRRSAELNGLDYKGLHKIRFEALDADYSYEQECYISSSEYTISPSILAEQTINFIGVSEATTGAVIPREVMDVMRCPNCGAPIKSRYGACDYCSGWSEILW